MNKPKPVRRLITVDDAQGRSRKIFDGPSPDVRTDPARPGYSATRIWVTDRTPARIGGITDTLHLPHTLEPPPGGSVCRVITFPPERGQAKESDVQAFFAMMGSPAASTGIAGAPHPYMQRTQTLDLCLVLAGEITLVLDTAEVQLKAGDTVVQRGTNHAWSNRSDQPCTIAFSSHHATN